MLITTRTAARLWSVVMACLLASTAPALADDLGASPAAAVESVADDAASAASQATDAPAPADVEELDPLFDEDYDELIEDQPAGFPDPLENVNRAFLTFNRQVDRWVLDPVTELYGWLLPDPLKTGVRNVFENIGSVPVFVNDVLQLRWRDAAITVNRAMLNSTVGLGGLFDPAASFGVVRHDSDFGQTMALIGVGSGPYLVLPVLGPTTVRDGVGGFVDSFVHPVTYLLPGLQRLTYGTGSGLSLREEHLQGLNALKESSVDFYAALRNAYYQNRVAEIEKGRTRRDEGLRALVTVPERSCTPPARIARRLHTHGTVARADCFATAQSSTE